MRLVFFLFVCLFAWAKHFEPHGPYFSKAHHAFQTLDLAFLPASLSSTIGRGRGGGGGRGAGGVRRRSLAGGREAKIYLSKKNLVGWFCLGGGNEKWMER